MLNADLEADISRFRKAVEDCKLLVAECELDDGSSRPISPIRDICVPVTHDRYRADVCERPAPLDSARVKKCITSSSLTLNWCEGRCREAVLREEVSSRSHIHSQLSAAVKEVQEKDWMRIREAGIHKKYQYEIEVLQAQVESTNTEREELFATIKKLELRDTDSTTQEAEDQLMQMSAMIESLQRDVEQYKYEARQTKERCQFLEMSLSVHVQSETDSLERFMSDEVSQLHIRLAEEQIKYQDAVSENHVLVSRIEHLEAVCKEVQSETDSLRMQMQSDRGKEGRTRSEAWVLDQLQLDDSSEVPDGSPSLMRMLEDLKAKYELSQELHTAHESKLQELQTKVHEESTISKTWQARYVDLQKKFELYHPSNGDISANGANLADVAPSVVRPAVRYSPSQKMYTSLVDPHHSSPPVKNITAIPMQSAHKFYSPLRANGGERGPGGERGHGDRANGGERGHGDRANGERGHGAERANGGERASPETDESKSVSPNVGKDSSPRADVGSPVRANSPGPSSPPGPPKIFIHTRPPKPIGRPVTSTVTARRCVSPSLPRSVSLTQPLYGQPTPRSTSASSKSGARAPSPATPLPVRTPRGYHRSLGPALRADEAPERLGPSVWR